MQPTPRTHAPVAAAVFFVIAACLPMGRTDPTHKSEPPGRLTVLISGERQSQIEPCGCIQKKLGGVQYEARLHETPAGTTTLRVDVGGFSSRLDHPEDAMRTRYALQAMASELNFDAINVAARDLQLGIETYRDLGEHLPAISDRLISANIVLDRDREHPAFQRYRMIQRATDDQDPFRVLVTGTCSEGFLSSPAASATSEETGFHVEDPEIALASVLDAAPEHDLLILLAHMGTADTLALAKAFPEVDLIVSAAVSPRKSANPSAPPVKPPIIYLQGSEGKLLGQAELTRSDPGTWELEDETEWLEVSPSLEPVPALAKLIESYKSNTEEMIIRRPRNPARVFAGARACATCHVQQYDDWKSTRHARALETLVSKGMQFDSRCLECHTLGFGRDNGFYNVRESMAMAGVQCETCHGPAAEHADLQHYLESRTNLGIDATQLEPKRKRAREVVPSRQVSEQLCLKCHTPENDDHFVFHEKIRKVDHRGASPATQPSG